jgi:dipeptidyl-peptidase-4
MDRPQDNPDGYAASAVINRLEKYRGDKTNMVRLTHGTGDDNVHMQNTLQVVDKLQSMDRDFELMFYPGGMHGYRGGQQRHYEMQNYRFWYEYLLGQELPEVLKQR